MRAPYDARAARVHLKCLNDLLLVRIIFLLCIQLRLLMHTTFSPSLGDFPVSRRSAPPPLVVVARRLVTHARLLFAFVLSILISSVSALPSSLSCSSSTRLRPCLHRPPRTRAQSRRRRQLERQLAPRQLLRPPRLLTLMLSPLRQRLEDQTAVAAVEARRVVAAVVAVAVGKRW